MFPVWSKYLVYFTACSRVRLEKVTVSQLIKKFSVLYGTWMFITASTRNRPSPTSPYPEPDQSSPGTPPPNRTSWRPILIYRLSCNKILKISDNGISHLVSFTVWISSIVPHLAYKLKQNFEIPELSKHLGFEKNSEIPPSGWNVLVYSFPFCLIWRTDSVPETLLIFILNKGTWPSTRSEWSQTISRFLQNLIFQRHKYFSEFWA